MQAQLTVGAVDDPQEKEADQVAEAVTGVPAPPAAGTPPPMDGDAGGADASDGNGGSGVAAGEEDGNGVVQRSPDGTAAVADGWPGLVQASLTGGRPVAERDRASVEAQVGTDLAGVRVHDDGPADAAARAVGARAFTVGKDVVFRSGEYQTATPGGRRLLAHELTHVAQQRGSAPSSTGGGTARLRRDPDPNAKPSADPAKDKAKKPPSFSFAITPDRVMTPTEFRVWISMELLGVDEATAKQHATTNNWWGPHATKGVTAKDVGKKTTFTYDAELWWKYRGAPARALSPEVQQAIGVGRVAPEDYPQLVRIASKLTPAEWADYVARARARTTDLNEIEASVDRYLRWKKARDAEAKQYKDVHTKLLGNESLLRLYREYQKAQKVATEGKQFTLVGAAGGGIIYIPPTQTDKDQAEALRNQLTTQLVDAGFPGGIPEFEQALKDYVKAFETQALDIAMTALDYYEAFLFRQAELYQSDEVVGKLYDSLAPYRTAYLASAAQAAAAVRFGAPPEEARRPGGGGIQPSKANQEKAQAAKAESATQEGKAKAELQGLKGTHPIFGEDNLPTQRRISKKDLALADKAGLKAVLAQHIADRTTDIRNTRDNIRQDPALIYKMDNLMKLAKAKLEVAPGSVFDELINERAAAIQRKEALIAALLAALAIAFTIVTFGGGAIAVGATLGLLTVGSIGAYHEYERYRVASEGAGTGLVSKEPSPVWLVLSVAGVVFDAAAVAKAVSVVRPAALALEAGGTVDDFRKAVQLLETQGKLETRIARSVEQAAEARTAYGAARRELSGALGKMYGGLGPFSDPDVYKAVVKMAAARIRQGLTSVEKFILDLNKLRVDAKLAELSGKELAIAKQAFREGEVVAATSTRAHSGAGVPYSVTGPHSLLEGTSVYVLKDAKGKVLYVGKGGPLERLRAHISDPKKTQWFGEIAEVEVRSTKLTNSEALALEEDLIGQLKPAHNIDKTPFQSEFGTSTTVGANLPKPQPTLKFTLDWGH